MLTIRRGAPARIPRPRIGVFALIVMIVMLTIMRQTPNRVDGVVPWAKHNLPPHKPHLPHPPHPPQEPQESKEPQEAQELQGAQAPEQPQEPQEPQQLQEPQQPQEPHEPQDHQESQEPDNQDHNEHQEPQPPKQLQDTHENKENQEPYTPQEDAEANAEKERQQEAEIYEQNEQRLRDLWTQEYKNAAKLSGANNIYGNTVASLVGKEARKFEHSERLWSDPSQGVDYTRDIPVFFDPYPDYNGDEWIESGRAPYVDCNGPDGLPVDDLLVFKGHPHRFPAPGIGSYDVLNMDGNLCFERETRLGPYGLKPRNDSAGNPLVWDKLQWGRLQRQCLQRNGKRYRTRAQVKIHDAEIRAGKATQQQEEAHLMVQSGLGLGGNGGERTWAMKQDQNRDETRRKSDYGSRPTAVNKEPRTAVLLRSSTDMRYTENDKQNMRALVTELSLRSGGEYEVFLLVHVKEHNGFESVDRIPDDETYRQVLDAYVPREFHDMTVLWDDRQVWDLYPALQDDAERSVHEAQWLTVQKFSRDHPEFDHVWNWEMDFRFTGHYYELLEKLGDFGARQPRRGIWERSERYYIPAYHGDYDTDFRKMVEARSGRDTVWGPSQLPFLSRTAGPTPPVADPEDDPYEWGVGEPADYITLSPMFNPSGSRWVMGEHVWRYDDDSHRAQDLPRRATIVTQSRLSRRLLNAMHEEETLGNHVASEMTPQTVSLLHGLKAVYAPHPVFFDRPWDGVHLQRWFNAGFGGVAGGEGSAMGWGREGRYEGVTWYYRAVPPGRLYNNWAGYTDTGLGGAVWEEKHGRTCLPPIALHPVKDVKPTADDYQTKFDLPFG